MCRRARHGWTAVSRALGTLAALLVATHAPAAAGDVLIAVAAPIGGPHAAKGVLVRTGVQDAADRINASGGVNGNTIVLSVHDDQCTAEGGAMAARALSALAPALVVGHPCPSAAAAAAPIYAAADIILIATGPRHKDITDPRAGESVFRLAGRHDRQGEAAAQWLTARADDGPVAVLHDPSAYARALAKSAAGALRARGHAGARAHEFATGRLDYAALAQTLAREPPRAVFLAAFAPEAALILGSLGKAGIQVPLLGADTLAADRFGTAALAYGGDVRVLLPAPSADDALARLATAAVEIWSAAARSSAAAPAQDLTIAIAQGTFETSTVGPVSFDANGDARMPSFVPAHWSSGRWIAEE